MQNLSIATITIQEVLPTEQDFYDQIWAATIPDVVILCGILAVIAGFFLWIKSII